MEEKDMAMLAATMMIGILQDGRATADEKNLKRSVDMAYRLMTIVKERQVATKTVS